MISVLEGRSAFRFTALSLLLGGLFACTEAHDVKGLRGHGGADDSADAAGDGTGDVDAGVDAGDSTGNGSTGKPHPGGTGGSDTGGNGTGGVPGTGTGGNPGGVPPTGDISKCSPCMGATTMAGDLPACCTTDGKCGLDLGALGGGMGGGAGICLEQHSPGTLNPSCPDFNYMGFVTVPGCCKEDHTCGVMVVEAFAPLGCTDINEFMGMGGGQKQNCN